MGQSTNGQICYGVSFEEETEFPWSDEKYDNGIEDWWKEVQGYINPETNPFGDDGNFKPGMGDDSPELDRYFKHSHAWEDQNPIPVVEVNTCSGDYPMWILAVPGTEQIAYRGSPEKFDPAALTVDPEKLKKFAEFLKEFEIKGEPAWYLSSYWG